MTMKIRYLFAILLLLLGTGLALADDYAQPRDVFIRPGGEVTLTIEYTFARSDYRNLNFDLNLPAGLTLKTDAQGNPLVTLAFEGTDHQVAAITKGGDDTKVTYRFVIYSQTNACIPAGEHVPLLHLTLQCDESVPVIHTLMGWETETAYSYKDGDADAVSVASNVSYGFVYVPGPLALPDDQDNTDALTSYAGSPVDATLQGRTLKANVWNTICLPFYVSPEALAASPLAGATIRTLDNYENDGTTVTVKFADDDRIRGGRPYIVKFSGDNIVSPTFEAVRITTNTVDDAKVTKGGATFIGTYTPTTLNAGDKTKLFLQSGNLYWPDGDVTVNSFRAYFTLASEVPTTTVGGAPVRFVVDFGDGETTDIHQLMGEKAPRNADVYDLQGRKVAHPAKGLYIVSGKKVLVK